MITSCVEMRSPPETTGPPMMTSPGALWHAIVKYGLVASPACGKIPATRKMQVRGPLAWTQPSRLPLPLLLVFVTSITTPPRPPIDSAPPPSAPGNAGQPELGQLPDDELADGVEGVEGVEAAETVTLAVADMLASA